jgi:hypothetical protein
MLHLVKNDQGGITYASQQRIGDDQRSEILQDVRMVCDGLNEVCAKIRESWPERYPMPEDLDAMLRFQDYALARVRSGSLKRFAKACAQ